MRMGLGSGDRGGTYLHVDRFGNNVVCKGDEGMRECTWIDANDERQLAIWL